MASKMRKTVIQIAQPNLGYQGSERYSASSTSQPPLIADAYLFNGEPTNNLTMSNQLVPRVQPLERTGVALALSERYPLQTTFKGYSITGNNRTSWTGR